MRRKNKPDKSGKPEADGIGAILASARNAKGIPIEQAAHETRVNAARLLEIENNDFSNLSHPTYARMFIANYARYLGVPVEEIQDKLPETGAFGGEGYQYLQALPTRSSGKPTSTSRPRPVSPIIPALAGLVLLILLAVGGFSVWITLRNINRLTAHSPKPAPVTAAASATPSPTATPSQETPVASTTNAPTPDLAALNKEDAGLLQSPAPDAVASPSATAATRPVKPSDDPWTISVPQPSPASHQ